MPLTVPQQISIGALCALYTSNELESGTRHGGVIDPKLPHLIYAVNQGLKWLYELDTTDSDLVPIGNYLISICRQQFRAQGVLALNNGGTVAPITPNNPPPNDIDFIVSSTSLIATGDTEIYLDGTGGPDLRGYDIDFFRGSQVQYTTPQQGGAAYYSWNNVTGLLRLLPTVGGQALVDEPMRISPKTGGGATVVPTQEYPIVITSADFEADGVTYLNSLIVGDQLFLLANNVPNPALFAPTDFVYVSGGIEIILSAFNANVFDYTIVINKIN